MATFMKHQKCHVSFCAIVIVGYGWRWRCLKMAAGLLEFRLRKALLIQAILTLIRFSFFFNTRNVFSYVYQSAFYIFLLHQNKRYCIGKKSNFPRHVSGKKRKPRE